MIAPIQTEQVLGIPTHPNDGGCLRSKSGVSWATTMFETCQVWIAGAFGIRVFITPFPIAKDLTGLP
jgi:hypothetical protein